MNDERRGLKLGRDTSAAAVDGATQSRDHHEAVGERQGRQPAQHLLAAQRVEGLRNLRKGFNLVAAVGFWKELHGEDLIEEYARLSDFLDHARHELGGAEDLAVVWRERAQLAEVQLEPLKRIIAWYWRTHGPYPPDVEKAGRAERVARNQEPTT